MNNTHTAHATHILYRPEVKAPEEQSQSGQAEKALACASKESKRS